MNAENATSASPPATLTVAVWDGMVRWFHWLLVESIVVAWASIEGWLRNAWHEPAGYVASALLSVRLVWGFIGGRYARFAQFVHAPQRVLDYARRVLRGGEPRYI